MGGAWPQSVGDDAPSGLASIFTTIFLLLSWLGVAAMSMIGAIVLSRKRKDLQCRQFVTQVMMPRSGPIEKPELPLVIEPPQLNPPLGDQTIDD